MKNHGRQSTIITTTTSEADMEEQSTNNRCLDELSREELLSMLKAIYHAPGASSSTVSTATAGTTAYHGNDGVKSCLGAFAAFSASAPPSHGGIAHGVVSWDSTDVEAVEGRSNTWNSPNDQQDRCSRPSLQTISGVLSTDGSGEHRGSVSAILPNVSSAAQGERHKADTTAPWTHSDGEAGAAAAAAAAEKGARDKATEPYEVQGQEVVAAAAPATLTTADGFFVASTDTAGELRVFDPFSPLSNVLEVESKSSPSSGPARIFTSTSSAVPRHPPNATAGRGANQYSCRSLNSSAYEAVGNSVADRNMTVTMQQSEQQHGQQKQQHSRTRPRRVSRPVAFTASTFSSSQGPFIAGRGDGSDLLCTTVSATTQTPSPVIAHKCERASAPLGSEMSLRPAQLETLPPPQDLSLQEAQLSSGQHEREHEEHPSLLGQAVLQADNTSPTRPLFTTSISVSGKAASTTTAPKAAPLFECVPAPLISPSSHTTTTPDENGSARCDGEMTAVPPSERGGPFLTPPASPVFLSSNNKSPPPVTMVSATNDILRSPGRSPTHFGGVGSSLAGSGDGHATHRASLALDSASIAESPLWREKSRRDDSNRSPAPLSPFCVPQSSPVALHRRTTEGIAESAAVVAASFGDDVLSPHPLSRVEWQASASSGPAPLSTNVVGSTNTLVSVDMDHTTTSTPTSAGPVVTTVDTAASAEFKTWTHIVSWDKDTNGRLATGAAGGNDCSCRNVLSSATTTPTTTATATATTTTTTTTTSNTVTSLLQPYTSSEPRSNIRLPTPSATESPSSQQNSILAPSYLSSSVPEEVRTRQTASLRRVRHARTGERYINNYRILKSLGRGSCGKVKLAYDETESRLVAIKNVRRADSRKHIGGLTTAQMQYNAFMREIEVMKKLRHRNIVSLYEVIDDPTADKLYLVMQYVDKGVVAKVEVRANSDFVCDPIPPAQLARYTREMLTGLQYLHAHDVVHRDLKPDNILVSKNGHAYLADFGVAETFDTSYQQRRESMMAQSLAMSMAMSVAGGRAGGPEVLGTKGTPLFIAPELWSGTKSYGKPVDMWAMGVTLFTLLVGKLPFRSPEDITDAQYTPTVPEEFGEKWRVLLKGLLNRDPRTRWTVEKALRYFAASLTKKKRDGASRRGSASNNNNSNKGTSASKTLSGGAATASTVPAATVSDELNFLCNLITPDSTASRVPCGRDKSKSSEGGLLRPSAPLRRTSSGSAGVRTELLSSSLGPRPRAPWQPTCDGGPRRLVDEKLDVAFRNTISSYPTTGSAHHEVKSSMLGLPATSSTAASKVEHRRSVPRLHRLEEPTPPRLPYSKGRCSLVDYIASLTHVPTLPERVPPPQPVQHRHRSSSGGSGDCPDMPSFEGSGSDTASLGRGECVEEREAAAAAAPPVHTHSNVVPPTSAYRLFAALRASRLLAEANLAAANADPSLTQPYFTTVPCPVSVSAGAAHATASWTPVSTTLAAHSAESASMASSHILMPSTAMEKAGMSATAQMLNASSPSRLPPPSAPQPFSLRLSNKEESRSTPANASTATASPYLTATHHSRTLSSHSRNDDRCGSLIRSPALSYGAAASTPPKMISSNNSSNNSSSNSSNAGRGVLYPFSSRAAGGTDPLADSRDRSLSMTPMDAAMGSVTSAADALAYPRSPARLPSIVSATTSTPSLPSCASISATFSAPSVLRPIKAATQPNLPSRLLVARLPRYRRPPRLSPESEERSSSDL